MNIETALAALRTAGYRITSLDAQTWRIQPGLDTTAQGRTVTSAEIIALVQPHVPSPDLARITALTLAQSVAMLRAAGLTVEPVGPGYWQVQFVASSRTHANLFAAERLHQLGNIVAQAVPGLLRSQHPYWQQQQEARRSIDLAEVCYTLSRLGWATSADLAALVFCDPAELAATLDGLTQAGELTAGPEETWTLAATGWHRIAHLVPAGTSVPAERDLPDPRLAQVVARLILALRPLQLSRMELLAPGLCGPLADSRGRSLLLTVAPEPRGNAWTRDLAGQAANMGAPMLRLAIEFLEADRATSHRLDELITLLREAETSTPILPCLVTSDPGLAEVVQAELRGWRPMGPWLVGDLRGAMESRWMTAPSGQFELDLSLAFHRLGDGWGRHDA
jgi:hypothetical protein